VQDLRASFPVPQPGIPHVVLHDRVAAGEGVFLFEPGVDPPGRLPHAHPVYLHCPAHLRIHFHLEHLQVSQKHLACLV